MSESQTCGNCKHIDVDGVIGDQYARCRWQPPGIPLPLSVVKVSFRLEFDRHWVDKDWTDCPVWEAKPDE